jgi:nucleoside-diphosphate-sugar epimerase
MSRSILLVGPGWLGGPTAALLASQGNRVFTLQRSEAEPPAGCTAVTGHLETAAHDTAVLSALSRTVDHLVVCVSPSRARGDDYGLYPAAAEGATALADVLGCRSIVWVSSTGIYDRQDGSIVTEQTPLRPTDARVQALADAEMYIARAANPRVPRIARIVRAAGLYGPGRDPAARFMSGATPADIWCNFAWRDDVRDAIAHLLATPPEAAVEIFNCADGNPVQAGEIYRALTGRAPDAATPTDRAAQPGAPVRAGRSNQRIVVDALKATGWSPSMPTVFDGLRALGHRIA